MRAGPSGDDSKRHDGDAVGGDNPEYSVGGLREVRPVRGVDAAAGEPSDLIPALDA
jgi:hypothetical protein